ncbi:membrane protein insertase YidC [Parasulfitobacter algicola]|uniref:Membrane protein insertase YidC n=1 Tax=Parasulfitobacter algicola TaxID=2614809 RepID=A0ABX2INY5_9RHOB|nr:membrane protein insertase YidC [Sulfitobacter algicola]NSX54065.1 membrane protein insertase YidC [Sulfitobacter algicola]
MNDQNKNLILACVLSFLVIIGWSFFFPAPEPPLPTETQQPVGEGVSTPIAADPVETVSNSATEQETLQSALSEAPRVPINTPELGGSISLLGGRIDDLALKSYREELDPESDIVRLLSPFGANDAYYALYGWAPGAGVELEDVPGPNTLWTLEQGDELTVDTPVVLLWDNGNGLSYRRTISVDKDFMFSIEQSIENNTAEVVTMAPYGIVARHGEPDIIGFFILHEGIVRMSDGTLDETDYDDMTEFEFLEREGARADVIRVETDGWIGFTDKNWMTTLIPQPGTSFRSVAKYDERRDIYQVEAVLGVQTVQPGTTASASSQLFAGAKEWEAIRDYQNEGGIKGFIDSIDWGWFFFLTKPIFWLLHELNLLIGNMGWSIIALTFIIKALLLPLAYKSYVSMARMKELQPEMEKLKEAAGDDKQKMQQGMIQLYKTNKVNPAAGCLPILLQIPIFFSLYKVIFVTIELRHAPWLGWIRDLSAPDPSSILNFFGLFPWDTPDPGSFFFIFSLGVLPILLGVSMWLQQKLNPAPTDATQAMVFAWMPWIFMFMLGSFASGLVLYWIANNMLTFTQQYVIMRSQGIKPDIFGNIKSSFKKPKQDAK